jgi:hypothetical protein
MGCAHRVLLFIAATLAGCGSATTTSSLPQPNDIRLSQRIAYLGSAGGCRKNCLRGPAIGYDIHVSQVGNVATFGAGSSDATVVTGSLTMLGPGGHGDPAIMLRPHRAGSATLTIAGIGGKVARLPVVITTVSTMTIVLDGFPSAAVLNFSVMAPVNPACPGFEGGYSFNAPAPVPPSKTITLGNFPAMGNGQSSLCLFTTVSVTVQDGSGTTLAQKTVEIPIRLGHDNPTTIAIP